MTFISFSKIDKFYRVNFLFIMNEVLSLVISYTCAFNCGIPISENSAEGKEVLFVHIDGQY